MQQYSSSLVENPNALSAETLPRPSQDLLEGVLEAIPAPFFFKNTAGRYLGCNKAFLEYLGLSHQNELIGKTVHDIVSTDLADYYHEQDLKVLQQQVHLIYEGALDHPDGTRHHLLFTKMPFFLTDGSLGGLTGTIHDITQRKAAEREAQRLAHYDSLTGLPNRVLLQKQLNHILEQARNQRQPVGLLVLDQGRLKDINDTFGYTTGDRILQEIASRLSEQVNEPDLAARIEGDKFALVLAGVSHDQEVARCAQQIINELSGTVIIEGHEINGTGNIGIAIFPADGTDSETLLANAMTALNQAKQAGRKTYHFFSRELSVQARQNLTLETALEQALKRGEFSLHYQPQMNLSNGQLDGVEALLRWQHPELGQVPPDKFIPVAEQTGLILPLGEWVLKTACRQNRAWQLAGLPPLRMAINLSAKQLKQPRLVASIAEILQETNLAPEWLELELTETSVMKHTGDIRTLIGLKDLGIGLAIDDFGTGYSSLSYLRHLPINKLKIDRSFIREITSRHDDATIVAAIIVMAHSLGIQVVAEGVETTEQLAFLQQKGCDRIQGYLLARPMPTEALTELIRTPPS